MEDNGVSKEEWEEIMLRLTVRTIDGTLKHGFIKGDSMCLYLTDEDEAKLLKICEEYYKLFSKDIYVYYKRGFAYVSWNPKHKGSFTRSK
jgi:hypothetical protein